VFADLGFSDSAERHAKLRFAYALNQVLEARKLSQGDAAKVLGVTLPKVSALRHYKLAGFSVERVMNLLTPLDQDVEIVIRRKRARGRLDRSASSLGKPTFPWTDTQCGSSTAQIIYSGRRRAPARLRKRL
jgi:predicted XRE-type DNA-binding protein